MGSVGGWVGINEGGRQISPIVSFCLWKEDGDVNIMSASAGDRWWNLENLTLCYILKIKTH